MDGRGERSGDERAERRQHARLVGDVPAALVVKRYPTGDVVMRVHEGRLVNRSRTGACLAVGGVSSEGFHLLKCLEDPELYEVELHVAGPAEKTPRAEARVVWLNRVYEDGGARPFRVGLELDPWRRAGRPKVIPDPTSERLGGL